MSHLQIAFPNSDMVALYELELKGQISDGQWENSRPMDHWHVMCDARAVVDPTNVGPNFRPRRRYAFASPDLIEVIGTRMIAYVKLARRYGLEAARRLEHLLKLDGTWQGIPNYPGQYWDEVRAYLRHFDIDEVRAVVEAPTYDEKQLKKDLRQMSKIVNAGRD